MRARTWLTCLLLLSLMLLTGCGTGTSRGFTGPPVLDYSDQVQNHAADEMATLGPPCPAEAVFGGCSAVKRFVLDYFLMREQLRAVE